MIARLQKSIYKNLFNRNFGGTIEPGVADPYISGFGYIWFDKLPPKLSDYVRDFSNEQDIRRVLSALCIRITMPTETLNKTTIQGMGGKKWSAATSIDVGDVVTLAFLEMSGTPVKKIISGWINMIRDIRNGTAQLEGDEYSKALYSATAYHITAKPDGKTIETTELLTGLFPQKNPYDSFNVDIATNEKVEIDIDFNLDNIWDADSVPGGQSFVLANAQKFLETIAEAKKVYINWNGTSTG